MPVSRHGKQQELLFPYPLRKPFYSLHQITTMAANLSVPLSSGNKPDMKMPMPPPLLHTRSGNEFYDRPSTPTQNGFTSPMQTPTGSPSKKQLPPGANDIANAFDQQLKLGPLSPSNGQAKSPNKRPLSGSMLGDANVNRDPFADSVNYSGVPGSPTRKSNKENTPPSGLPFGKSLGLQQNQAALSRQEPYQQADSRKGPAQTRGLTAEELQKLQMPKVKRLANVTQLCESFLCKI